MRARWTYVSTGTLVAIALGAPFVLPRALDSHGSAAFALEALAPPRAQNAVVRMDALLQPKRAPRVKQVAAHTAPRVYVARASLASVRSQAAPAAARKAAPHKVVHVNHWYPKHRPAPVDTARAPQPPAPPPPTPVVAAQPVDLNASTDQPAAPAPAPEPAPAAPPVAVLASVPQNDQGSPAGDDNHGNGNANGHDKELGNGHGHGHDHGD